MYPYSLFANTRSGARQEGVGVAPDALSDASKIEDPTGPLRDLHGGACGSEAHPDDSGIDVNRSAPRPVHYCALDQWRVSTMCLQMTKLGWKSELNH